MDIPVRKRIRQRDSILVNLLGRRRDFRRDESNQLQVNTRRAPRRPPVDFKLFQRTAQDESDLSIVLACVFHCC